MSVQSTPQPTPPYQQDGKWFFTHYTLKGEQKIGPYENEAIAKIDFIKALRIHEANGYTDGNVGIIS
jgi:hypothetical protein